MAGLRPRRGSDGRLGGAPPSPYRPRWKEVAARVATRFSAQTEDLALVENATDGLNAVLRSIGFQPGDEIMISSLSYGAVANMAKHVAREKGARVVVARIPFPYPSAVSCASAIRAAITPRTKLAILDHVTSATALVLPIMEMTQACHDRDVMVLVDGAHVPGNIPLDIPSIGADWYVANLHKWYFVPRGCGFLWARRDRQLGLAPAVVSWDIERLFPGSFEWTGTRDPAAVIIDDEGGAKMQGSMTERSG